MTGLVLVAGGLAYHALVDPWPAQVEFHDAWPLCFAPDGRSFALFNPGMITFRNCATGRERFVWSLPESVGKVVVAGAFSPDGRTFAAALRQNNAPAEVALIDVATRQIRATGTARQTQVGCLGFTADGSAVRMGTAESFGFGEVVSFNATTGATEFVVPAVPLTPLGGVAVVDGRMLLYLDGKEGPISLQEVAQTPGAPPPERIGLTSAGASGAIALAPDRKTLAIGRRDGTIDLWDIPGRCLRQTIPAPGSGYALWIVFGPDGRTISVSVSNREELDLPRACRTFYHRLTGGSVEQEPPELVVIDLATGEPLARSSSVFPFYAPDGRTLVTRDGDHCIRLRNVPNR